MLNCFGLLEKASFDIYVAWQTALYLWIHYPAHEWPRASHPAAGARAQIGLADDAATVHELLHPCRGTTLLLRHSDIQVICSDLYC